MTEDNEFLFAQLTAVVRNFSSMGAREPVSPRDYMPSQRGNKPAMKRRSRQVIADEFRSFVQNFRRPHG